MFDVSFSEIMVIGTVALIVLGPDKTKESMRFLGKAYSKARTHVSKTMREIESEAHMQPFSENELALIGETADMFNGQLQDTEPKERSTMTNDQFDKIAFDEYSMLLGSNENTLNASIPLVQEKLFVAAYSLPLPDETDIPRNVVNTLFVKRLERLCLWGKTIESRFPGTNCGWARTFSIHSGAFIDVMFGIMSSSIERFVIIGNAEIHPNLSILERMHDEMGFPDEKLVELSGRLRKLAETHGEKNRFSKEFFCALDRLASQGRAIR